MSWPLSHEFNEAIQNPKVAFADPDLRDGEPVVGATGLPLPRSGNFADVYQIHGADGRDWAVKCFTRPVTGLAERYARVSDALEKANLPFNVGFKFLAEGIRVGGVWRPVVKMEWVEGMLLNQVVRDAAEKPATLGALGQMWVKLCKRLREAGIAHADLQHGNVLLVPGTRAGAYGLKLIDYDGVWVPALANTPSGESGHPSFQHPARAATRNYSPDVDRFPHLVVATALRGLSVAGATLWERYDNGDNLLFTEDDYKKPAASKAMRDLWQLEHPAVQALVGRLAIACIKPIPQTPWLDQLAPDGEPAPLDNATRHEAAAALGIALPVPVALPPEPAALPPEPAPAESPFAVVNEYEEQPDEVDAELVEEAPKTKKSAASRAKPKRGAKPARGAKSGGNGLIYAGVGAAVLVLVGIVAAVVMSGGAKPKPDDRAQNQNKEEPEPVVVPPAVPPKGPTDGPKPKDNVPPVIVPPKGPDNPPPPAPTVWALKERWKQPLPEDWKSARMLRIGADGRAGQVAAGDGQFVVFDTRTGESLKNPPDAAKIFYGVQVLNDARVVKTWQGASGPLQVWDARTGKEAAAPAQLIAGSCVYVSPNGRYVAVYPGSGQGKVSLKLIDTTTNLPLLETTWERGSVLFTADSSRALIADDSGEWRWIKLPSGEADGERHLGEAACTGMSGDGTRIVFSGQQLVDGRTGKVLRRLKGRAPEFGLSRDGTLALESRKEGPQQIVELTDTATGEVLTSISLAAAPNVTALGLAPDGSAAFAVVPAGGRLELVRYDITAGAPGAPAHAPGVTAVKERFRTDLDFPANQVQFGVDGRTVVAHEINKSALAVVDARTGAVTAMKATGPLRANNVVPLPGGRVGIRPTEGTSITLANVETGKTVGSLTLPPSTPNTSNWLAVLQISPDERFVAVGPANSGRMNPDTKKVEYTPCPVRVIDTRTNKTVVDVDWLNSGLGGRIAFSADSSRVLIVEPAIRGRWFKLPSGEPDQEWTVPVPQPTGTRVVALSRDGRVLLCDGPVNGLTRAFVIDGRTGARGATFPEQRVASYGVALSADGTRAVLSVPSQGAFVIADTSTGAEVARLSAPEVRGNMAVALAPDGRALAICERRTPAPLVVYDIPAGPGVAAANGSPLLLKQRWAAPLEGAQTYVQLHTETSSGLVLAASADAMGAFELTTGAPRAGFASKTKTRPIGGFLSLGNSKIGVSVIGENGLRVWNAVTGEEDPAKLTFPANVVPRNGFAPITIPSPGGKYVAIAGWSNQPDSKDHPLIVFDAGTKNELFKTSWTGSGTIHFASGPRLLVAEGNGRCRWFKVPSGKVDTEWTFEGELVNGQKHQVHSVSADGSVLGYAGPLGRPQNATGFCTVDGKTGKVIYAFPDKYKFSQMCMANDGNRMAFSLVPQNTTTTFEVVEARTGRVLGTTELPCNRAATALALLPHGSMLLVACNNKRTIHAFDVPGGEPGGAVAPPLVGGGDDPTEAALVGEPPALRSKWDSKVGDESAFDRLLVTPDSVLLGSGKGFSALEPKTGVPRTVGFAVLSSSGVSDLLLLQNGRIGTLAPKATDVRVWNGTTGGLVTRHAVPELAPGNTTPVRVLLAPNEKHLAVARALPPAGDHPAGPLKVFEVITKKEQLALDWKGGEIHFTTDSARVLAAEWTGKCRWFKLPSGDADGEWDLGPAPADKPHRVTSASDDGAVLGYTGPLAAKGGGNGSAVLDGKTGKPIRVFHKDYHPNSVVEVSADGKRVALLREVSRREVAIDVVELATGARVGRARFATDAGTGNPPVPLFAFAPDGRALVVYDPGRQRTHLFEVPATKGP